MKRQIRRGVFESNSSSTHSLTLSMKDDYDRWKKGETFLFQGSSGFFNYITVKPEYNKFYTKDECKDFARWYKFDREGEFFSIDWDAEDSYIPYLRELDFFDKDYYDGETMESYYGEFTTPSGETVVAFGGYSYNY